MVNKYYAFAGISFAVHSEVEIADTPFFVPFYTAKNDSPDYEITVKTGEIPERTGKEIYCKKTSALYESGGETVFYSSYPVALSDALTDYAALKRQGSALSLTVNGGLRDNVLFRALNVPALMLEKGSALFHSAFVIINGRAIVFTGKSGAGKTTQALLWQKHRGAKLVNGDRSALRIENGRLVAYPVPFCGSSDVALNEKAPIAAIVSLEQGSENIVRQLDVMGALCTLLGGISYEPRSEAESRAVVDIALRAAETGLVYLMTCRADDSAVRALETTLKV